MIPASELRVGNWLNLLIKDENYGEVKGELPFQIKDPQHFAKLFQPSSSGDLFAPIPLTPEILEDCCSDEDSIAYFFKDANGKMVFYWNKEEACLYLSEGLGWGFEMPHIKHVHQFQNAYYMATNTELTVNLPSNQSA